MENSVLLPRFAEIAYDLYLATSMDLYYSSCLDEKDCLAASETGKDFMANVALKRTT